MDQNDVLCANLQRDLDPSMYLLLHMSSCCMPQDVKCLAGKFHVGRLPFPVTPDNELRDYGVLW